MARKNYWIFLAPVFIVILVVCLFFQKPPISTSLPPDLEIRYSYGACNAEWGRTNIVIDEFGNGIFEKGSGSLTVSGRFSKEDFRKSFSLNDRELLNLLNYVEEGGFFALQDQYSDPTIVDGSCQYITVTKNNSTKSVSVSNMGAPAAYSEVAGKLSAIARAKTGEEG